MTDVAKLHIVALRHLSHSQILNTYDSPLLWCIFVFQFCNIFIFFDFFRDFFLSYSEILSFFLIFAKKKINNFFTVDVKMSQLYFLFK